MVDALRRIHTALTPGGALVDTQPVGSPAPVRAEGEPAGELEAGDWVETVAAVDAQVQAAIDAGLFESRHEERYTIVHSFDSGPEALEEAESWAGHRIPEDVAAHLTATRGGVEIELKIRLRLFVRS